MSDDDPDTDGPEFELEYRDDGVPIVPPPDPELVERLNNKNSEK